MGRIVGAIVDELFLRNEVGIGSRSQLEFEQCVIKANISLGETGAMVEKSGGIDVGGK